MRKTILVAVTLLCSGLWAFAQSTSSPSSTSPSSSTSSSSSDMSGQSSSSTAGQMGSSSSATGAGNTSIEGCLSGSAGNYTLRDKASGTTYNLTGPDSQIASHVGQEVRASGSASNSSAASSTTPSSSASSTGPGSSSSSMSNGSSSNQSFMVSSITKVSSSCSNQ
ncbi:MAG TPA: hypothetical protein VGL89_11835 [Candidatus Koribacter sp.]